MAARSWFSELNGSGLPMAPDSARMIAQSSLASPGGNTARLGHLHAALGVDVGRRLFGVGRGWQDDVGAVRAGVAMGADIDDESLAHGRRVVFVGAEQEQHVEFALAGERDLVGRADAAIMRHEADVDAADAAGRIVQQRKAVPAFGDIGAAWRAWRRAR